MAPLKFVRASDQELYVTRVVRGGATSPKLPVADVAPLCAALLRPNKAEFFWFVATTAKKLGTVSVDAKYASAIAGGDTELAARLRKEYYHLEAITEHIERVAYIMRVVGGGKGSTIPEDDLRALARALEDKDYAAFSAISIRTADKIGAVSVDTKFYALLATTGAARASEVGALLHAYPHLGAAMGDSALAHAARARDAPLAAAILRHVRPSNIESIFADIAAQNDEAFLDALAAALPERHHATLVDALAPHASHDVVARTRDAFMRARAARFLAALPAH